MSSEPVKITLEDFEQTSAIIAPYISKTPVHEWRGVEIGKRLPADTRVSLKLELFQQTGTFKPRGAISVMKRLPLDALSRGVTAVSAGNHAIAAAYAAKCLDTSAKVVMISSANPARIDLCKAYGAEVIIAPDGKSAFELVAGIEKNEGRTFVHPFEGPFTAMGTGTIALEWLDQVDGLDAVILPIGGGGLCGGMAAAIKMRRPACKVYGVEPVGADTMSRSFAAGAPISRDDIQTIADSLAPPFALPYSFALCRDNLDDLVLVSDEKICDAMGLLFREMKLAVEPAAAAATAAALGPLKSKISGLRVGVIVCGANIDIETFTDYVRSG